MGRQYDRVIPRIKGGIGNQLFCYAAARRLAIVNNAELVLDDKSGFRYDHDYRRGFQLDHFEIPCRKATPVERLEPFSRARRFFKRAVNHFRPFESRSYIQQEGVDFDPRLLNVKTHGSVYIEGYWQSEQYFKDIESTIREDLRIIPPKDDINLVMADRIRRSLAVAVHVRFFDAPQEQGLNNAPNDYYTNAVTRMETIVPDAHYFIFSDQPAAACARIPLPDDRITLVSHNQSDANAYADLWLMTQCQHFITANSTFSWWGAWLADYAEKQVVAPGLKLREGVMSWGFSGLLPKEWIRL